VSLALFFMPYDSRETYVSRSPLESGLQKPILRAYLSLNELIFSIRKVAIMSRSGAVTFKGNPLTLAGEAVEVGKPAPDFTLHYFEGGLQKLCLADLKGKPTILSVVPSLDTPVCATQTKKFNDQLASLGDKVNAVTVSLDLPFAMNRFCGAESITNMRVGSDYQDRNFGTNWGTLIEELKIMSRAIFVLDADCNVVYAEYVPEVASEPNYEAAMEALQGQL
jgi:thioredoxin-dependent peroxiredoxin